VQANVATLAARGVAFVGPDSGELADGEWGMGRMAAIEAIVGACAVALSSAGSGTSNEGRPLAGRTLVVTAGGTEEPIDPVRVITNRSSGKMGFALAEEAMRLGATVRLIAGRTSTSAPAGVERIEATSAKAMAEAVLAAMQDADALIMAAAVSDYTPAEPKSKKIARENGGLALNLKATEDILAQVRAKFPKKHLVGFALETEDELKRGAEKLKRKGLDLIAVNNPTRPGSEFGSDRNDVTLLDAAGKSESLGLRPKREVAHAILLRVAKALNG
jgi:phosphopantothenoylcysteine decarboxylase / phosphopantothenate---cysteine ligase